MVWYGIRQGISHSICCYAVCKVYLIRGGGMQYQDRTTRRPQKFNSAMIRRNLPESEREPTKLQYESFCLCTLIKRRDIYEYIVYCLTLFNGVKD